MWQQLFAMQPSDYRILDRVLNSRGPSKSHSKRIHIELDIHVIVFVIFRPRVLHSCAYRTSQTSIQLVTETAEHVLGHDQPGCRTCGVSGFHLRMAPILTEHVGHVNWESASQFVRRQ